MALTPNHRKLANILAAFYGMKENKKNYTKAKTHLAKALRRYNFTTDDVLVAVPLAREIIRSRTLAFNDNRTLANAL